MAVVGLTHYGQDQLGTIVYFDLPNLGDNIWQFDKFGEVESVKTVSDIFGPLSGEVIEVNTALLDQPELTNEDPYGKGWLLRITITDIYDMEIDMLMSAAEYSSYIAELSQQTPS